MTQNKKSTKPEPSNVPPVQAGSTEPEQKKVPPESPPAETVPAAETHGGDTAAKGAESPGAEAIAAFTRKATASAEQVIGTSYTKVRTAVETGKLSPLCFIRWIDALLNWARHVLSVELFESFSAWVSKRGQWAFFAAEILVVLCGIVVSISRDGAGTLWIIGLVFAFLLMIVQYLAHRFLDAGKVLIDSSPSRLASQAFLDSVVLLAEIGACVVLALYVRKAWPIKFGTLGVVFVGIGFAVLCELIGWVALHPELLKIKIDPKTGAGEEAIGILSFLVKAVVRLVPLGFGVGALVGAFGLFWATITANIATGKASLQLLMFCGCLPLAAYLAFALYHLLLDLLRAVLVLPRKLDLLRRKTSK